MARAANEIVVEAPLRTVYNQWTQFEEYPRFMDAVSEVRQIDDRRLHWKAVIGGHDLEWDAEIQEQIPDQKIAWRSTRGDTNAGQVTFRPAGAGRTRVLLELSYEPEGFVESMGDALGLVEREVEGDLERFRAFIEARGVETGGWRGEIHSADAPGAAPRGLSEGQP